MVARVSLLFQNQYLVSSYKFCIIATVQDNVSPEIEGLGEMKYRIFSIANPVLFLFFLV